jgi:alginate O-acetyltransferase complex protein AlgI
MPPMLFSSPLFLFLFLPGVLAAYFLAPRKLKNAVLLSASLWFYAWGEPAWVLLMLASIGWNYALGLAVDSSASGRQRAGWLAVAVAVNLTALAYFKYLGFAVVQLKGVLAAVGISGLSPPNVRLPLGISFYTFQAMSYVIDVYRRQVRAAWNPLDVALYIALFPQLVAGPIVRYIDVAAEIRQRCVTLDGFAWGVQRFVIGLGKKVLVANALAPVADAAFEIPDGQLAAGVAWLGILCYTLQIYFDFSGYSDMAIGMGRMFGFRFLENFDYPYTAQSLTEFWRRWHISLSSWFRDYLYIPLGGNRRGTWCTYRNLLVVFVLCGLWHGASWSFITWGLFHGGFLILERLGLAALLARWPRGLRHAYTLLVVVASWVLFRATSWEHAWEYAAALVGLGAAANTNYHVGLYFDSGLALALAAACLGATPWLRWAAQCWPVERRPTGTLPALLKETARVAVVALVWLAAASALMAGTYNPFIYFRF